MWREAAQGAHTSPPRPLPCAAPQGHSLGGQLGSPAARLSSATSVSLCLGGLGQATSEADSEWNILEVRRAMAGACPFLRAVWARSSCRVDRASRGPSTLAKGWGPGPVRHGHGRAGWAPRLQPHRWPEEERECGVDATGDGRGTRASWRPKSPARMGLQLVLGPRAPGPRPDGVCHDHSGVGQVCARGEFRWLQWAQRLCPPQLPAARLGGGWRWLWCLRTGLGQLRFPALNISWSAACGSVTGGA